MIYMCYDKSTTMETSLHVHVSNTHAVVFQYIWPGSYVHMTKKGLSSASRVRGKTSVLSRSMKQKNYVYTHSKSTGFIYSKWNKVNTAAIVSFIFSQYVLQIIVSILHLICI